MPHSRRPMVVLDPITGYVGRAGVKDHHDAELRSVLEPLAGLADRRRVSILTIKHLNKDETKTVAGRVGGGVAYVNVPRACFVVACDPHDPSRRVLPPFKWNLNIPRPPALAWALEPVDAGHVERALAGYDHLGRAQRDELARQLWRIAWAGPVECDADDLLRTACQAQRARRGGEIDRATEWLQERLKDGPAPAMDCAGEGDAAIGRVPWVQHGLAAEQQRRRDLGRVEWWRETILKARLGGPSRRAEFNGVYYVYYLSLPGQL